MPDIAVLGSLNMDLVIRVPRVPEAGETLHAHSFMDNPGGKGGNQAVACARMGASVSMIGRVGDDAFGQALKASLARDGIAASTSLSTRMSKPRCWPAARSTMRPVRRGRPRPCAAADRPT